MTHTTEELQAMLAALDGALPLLRHDTQDYAEISGPCLQAMTTAPDAVMLLNDVPALLTELLASREALRVAEEALSFAETARATLEAYEADYGDQLPADHQIGIIEESREMPSFRIRVGHIRRVDAALTTIRSART